MTMTKTKAVWQKVCSRKFHDDDDDENDENGCPTKEGNKGEEKAILCIIPHDAIELMHVYIYFEVDDIIPNSVRKRTNVLVISLGNM